MDAILTGMVEEYGEVRIGNETYPSVSFSSRLVNARDATIVWAGMVSRTGADKVLLFDIRRISSMGKLVKSAVQSMASSMLHDQDRIVAALRPAASTPASAAAGARARDDSPCRHGYACRGSASDFRAGRCHDSGSSSASSCSRRQQRQVERRDQGIYAGRTESPVCRCIRLH